MTTFNYTEDDVASPSGNNKLSSRAKFFQRSMYKEVIYPEDVTMPLDSWYDKNLFGRVDPNQRVIVPFDSNLVQVSHAATMGIYCLNFLNDAFSDFVIHMQNAYLTNCINRAGNPALFRIKAVRAYEDPDVRYGTFMDN